MKKASTFFREITERVAEFKRYPRHIRSVARHGSYNKLRNALLVEREMRLGRTKLAGYPYKIIIDTCNYCTLRCPLCPTGTRELKRPQKIMTFDVYKKLLDKVKKYSIEVSLHNWGEPFLNRDIFNIIEYTSANNIGSNLSSHFNSVNEEDIDRIIKSGLEYLVVSLDGTDQNTYGLYRLKGNFDRVIQNVKNLVARKRELGSATPIIEWQFLVMRHNEHRIPEARNLSREIGADLIRFASPGLPFERFDDRQLAEKWMPANSKYWRLNPLKLSMQSFIINQGCFYLYRSLAINPEGSVAPCCVVYNSEYDFGNLLDNGLDEIWNNENYQSARALFSRDNNSLHSWTICNRCRLFKKGQEG